MTNVLRRQLHDNLRVVCSCWCYLPISLTESTRYKLWLWRSCDTSLVNVHLASVFAVARSLATEAKGRAPYFLVFSVFRDKIVVRAVQILVRYAPMTSHSLVVVTVPEIRILRFLLRIHNPFGVVLGLGIFSNLVDRFQMILAVALAQLYTLLANVHLSSVLAVARSSTTAMTTPLQKSDGQNL